MSQHKQGQILGLDLIRCAAAILVMLYHYCFCAPALIWGAGRPSYEPFISYSSLEPFTWFGWVGVEVFFVISGFVIAYSSRSATPLGFLKSRFLRLYPTLWICATMTLAVRLFGHEAKANLVSDWLHSVFLGPWTHAFLDGSYWTLPIELSFYALVLLLLATRTYQHLGGVVSFVGLTSSSVVIYEQATALGLLAHYRLADRFVAVAASPLRGSTLIRFGLYFALGTVLWQFLFLRRSVLRAALLAVFGVGAVAEMRWNTEQFNSWSQLGSMRSAGHLPWAVPVIVWAFAMAAIITSVVANAPVARLLGTSGAAFTRRLGLATYPIYLLHQAIGDTAIAHLHPYVPDILSLVLVAGTIIAFCLWVLPFIEEPIQRKFRHWLGVSRKDRATPAATLP